MGIIGSCGHGVEDFDDLFSVATKAWDITEEGWVRCIHYSSVCEDCYKDYEREGNILYTDEEETKWLREGDSE